MVSGVNAISLPGTGHSVFIKTVAKTRKGINILQVLQWANRALGTKQNIDVKTPSKMLIELSHNQ